MVLSETRLARFVDTFRERTHQPINTLKAQARLLAEIDILVNGGVAANEPYNLICCGKRYKAFVVQAFGMNVILIQESDSAELVAETVV